MNSKKMLAVPGRESLVLTEAWRDNARYDATPTANHCAAAAVPWMLGQRLGVL